MAVLYAWVSLNAIIVVALLAGVNIVLRRWSKVFRGLEAEQQLVATYHSSYTLLYLAIFFPMTYYGG